MKEIQSFQGEILAKFDRVDDEVATLRDGQVDLADSVARMRDEVNLNDPKYPNSGLGFTEV